MRRLHLPATILLLLLCHLSNVVTSFTNAVHKSRSNSLSSFHDSCIHLSEAGNCQSVKSRSWQLARCKSQLQARSAAAPTKETLELTEGEIQQSFDYLASLIQTHLQSTKPSISNNEAETSSEDTSHTINDNPAISLAKNRFIDLTTSQSAESLLENLFTLHPAPPEPIIKHAIIALQSLLIYAMQIGVKGSEEFQNKLVRHLFRPTDVAPPPGEVVWISPWTTEDIRRLKFYRSVELGKQVLAFLKRKRSAVGAYELMVEMGVWNRSEEVTLLRSGFPVRFLQEEIECSLEALTNNAHVTTHQTTKQSWATKHKSKAEKKTHDPDTILGIRQDLRHQKVYTIDSHSTLDIDDGISVEKISDPNNNDEQKLRYWIHIADVDHWASRGSELLNVAERRGISLYLPGMTLDMFPENMSSNVMPLTSNQDKYALSLGVQIHPDGTIDASSIIVTSSLIHVNYRLTYEQVDEMLDEGVGYTEEWEVGALLAAATKRRELRVRRGSSEGLIPCPIPKGVVTVTEDEEENTGYKIEINIETTHNSGSNKTVGGAEGGASEHYDPYASPVSSSQLIVTEMMILAGEALGKWHEMQPVQKGGTVGGHVQISNVLKLPYRRQPPPDYKTRVQESKQANFLLAMNNLYPHAWYCRRFFKPVQVSEEPGPHFGMGLDSYVQWSSPIRRLTDLKVHAALKRYLRRKRVNELLLNETPIPKEVTSLDIGYNISQINKEEPITTPNNIDPIDYKSGRGMIFAARPIQTSSSNFWLFEYIRRKVEGSESEVMFESIVLGCVDYERFQYAIYVYELGFEYRYLSENGKLDEGDKLWLKVASVNPRLELLTFSLASKSGGIHQAQPQLR